MRRTKEEAEQTREAILKSAVDVFFFHGVANATLEQIAKQAQVTRGAVYWHFKNKADIFFALYEELHKPFIQHLVEGLEKQHNEPLIHLQQLCCEQFESLENNPHQQRVLSLFLLKCDYTGNLQVCRENTQLAKAEKLEVLEKFFARAQEKGMLNTVVQPKILTIAFNCLLRGMIMEYLENPSEFSLGEQAPQILNVFFSQWR